MINRKSKPKTTSKIKEEFAFKLMLNSLLNLYHLQNKNILLNKKKHLKIDKKAELLKRREAAKVYDKLARRALFSPNH